jgi:hypothetical protein
LFNHQTYEHFVTNNFFFDAESILLGEEHRLRVLGNGVLRRIFGPKRDEVIGGWRKLYNEEFHNLYCSPSIIIKSRRMKCAGDVARMEEKRNA